MTSALIDFAHPKHWARRFIAALPLLTIDRRESGIIRHGRCHRLAWPARIYAGFYAGLHEYQHGAAD